MAAIRTYERPLAERLIGGLMDIPGVTLYGITDPARLDQRAPTAAFTLEGYTPRQVAERLGEAGIFAGTGTITRWLSPSGWGLKRVAAWYGWGLPITTQQPR